MPFGPSVTMAGGRAQANAVVDPTLTQAAVRNDDVLRRAPSYAWPR